MRLRATAAGLLAAISFGISAPVAKRLLPETGPLMLAALLYLGGGLGLTLVLAARKLSGRKVSEAPLRASDLPLLIPILVLGGVAGPLLMLWGLSRLTGVSAALLLNLEGPFTVLLAVLLFREHMGRYAWVSLAFVFGGSFILTGAEGPPGQGNADVLGALALAGACLAWGLDNNLTQRLSLKDPFLIARAKTLGAGAAMLVVALLTHHQLPPQRALLASLVLGSLSYGASIVLDAYALRHLGAVRESALFATAPFVGAVAALPILGERLSAWQAAAGLLMAVGVAALVRERHQHLHTHERLTHEHVHVHDEHHPHVHGEPVVEPHSHVHTHEPLTHEHPHVPDLHHRHRH